MGKTTLRAAKILTVTKKKKRNQETLSTFTITSGTNKSKDRKLRKSSIKSHTDDTKHTAVITTTGKCPGYLVNKRRRQLRDEAEENHSESCVTCSGDKPLFKTNLIRSVVAQSGTRPATTSNGPHIQTTNKTRCHWTAVFAKRSKKGTFNPQRLVNSRMSTANDAEEQGCALLRKKRSTHCCSCTLCYIFSIAHSLWLARTQTRRKSGRCSLGRREKDNPNPNPNLLLAALKIEAEHSFNPPKFNTANPCMR